MEQHPQVEAGQWFAGLQLIAVHIGITAVAIGIAFSLPVVARYILYQWWPTVSANANLLLATEICFSISLIAVFNAVRIAWENQGRARAANLAALVHVQQYADSRVSRWHKRRMISNWPATRDIFILTVTGFDTFANERSMLREPLNKAYEIRVMLLNPYSKSAAARVDSLSADITLRNFIWEVESSIGFLDALRSKGKKIALKFYEHDPFWKVAIMGDHAWVQYCHSGREIKYEPEYVFALNRRYPRQGLFVPFYLHFLERWENPHYPEYDFDRKQLVYHAADGRELRRVALGGHAERPAA